MASVSNSGETSPSRGIVLSDPAHRHRALRAARRHSWVVATLRLIILPAATLGLLANYFISLQTSTKIEDDTNRGTFRVSSIDLIAKQPTMRNPSYTGFNKKDGTEYVIRADRAITDLDENKPIDLFNISADVKQTNGLTLRLTSAEGQFHRKKDRLELERDIKVVSSNNMAAQLSRATVFPRKGIIVSNERVSMQFSAGTLEGRKLRIENRKNKFYLYDGVVARLHPDKNEKNGSADDNSASTLGGFAGNSDQPVDITANTLLVRRDRNVAVFNGSVTASQGNTKLTADAINVDYDATDTVGGASNIKKITAKDNVVITRDAQRITTRRATFDAERDVAELAGNVVISSETGETITGDKGFLNNSDEAMVLVGNVIAKQGENVLRGTRLDYDRKGGKLSLTDPDRKNGRITAKFVREGRDKPGAGANRDTKKGVDRKTAILDSQAFQTDPGAPINIEASRLDVDDDQRRATFSNNVLIKQGLFELRTAIVHGDYDGALGLVAGDTERSPSIGDGRQQTAQLKAIRAPQPITIVSQRGQYASGQSGHFDLERNVITLEGNVVLKQERQTVRGERLVIDLTSGLSRMEQGTRTVWQSVDTIESSNTDNPKACGGRTCAVFIIDNETVKNSGQSQKKPAKIDQKQEKKVQTPPAAVSGWDTSTSDSQRFMQPGSQ